MWFGFACEPHTIVRHRRMDNATKLKQGTLVQGSKRASVLLTEGQDIYFLLPVLVTVILTDLRLVRCVFRKHVLVQSAESFLQLA